MLQSFKSKTSELMLMVLLPVVALLLITSDINFSKSNQSEKTIVMSSVLRYVDKYYIDKSRISVDKMLEKGLLSLERTIDEVLIEYLNKDNQRLIDVHVSGNEKEFSISGVKTLDEMSGLFDDVFSFISSHYTPEDKSFSDIEFAVLDEMLNTLDPNSGIITPRIYKEFMIETKGSFGGLGIVIGIRDGDLTVISPIEGTPAYDVGIKSEDKIVQIEEDSTVNMSLLEAVSRLRGPKGSTVTIYVMREGLAEPKKYSIKRDTIKIESVDAFRLPDEEVSNIVYLKIRDFQKNTLNSIKEKLNKISGNDIQSISGIILDLRGNPGGLLDQAEKISDLFLQEGTIVSTRIGDTEQSFEASEEGFDYKGRIVVLVDSGSASASEIVAGALKNNDRAIVVGDRTFGKGSVQQIFNLEKESALKLTIANYYTPGNISIQDIGITPDIRLAPAIISKDDLKLAIADRGKRDNDLKLEEPMYTIRYLDKYSDNKDEEEIPDDAITREEKKKKLENDFAVNFAKQILKSSNPGSMRIYNLSKLNKELQDISSSEESKISEQLSIFGIDWSDNNKESETQSNLFVRINKSRSVVTAGESMDLHVEVKNLGNEPIYRITAITESDNPALNGKEFVFGKINPNGTSSWTDTFSIPKWYNSRQDSVMLKIYDHNNVSIDQSQFDITIKELPKPEFAYSYKVIDDGSVNTKGNGNGIPELNELIGIQLNLKNTGTGDSESSTLLLSDKNNESINLKKGRLTIDNLKTGQEKQGVFLFTLKNPVDEIDFDLQIIDDTLRETLSDSIKLKTATGNNHNQSSTDLKYRQAPKIMVSTLPYTHDSISLPVKGVISDSDKVDLVTIFVGDNKVYLNSQNSQELKVNANLKLEKGINYITFIARDNEGLEARKTFVVRRDV